MKNRSWGWSWWVELDQTVGSQETSQGRNPTREEAQTVTTSRHFEYSLSKEGLRHKVEQTRKCLWALLHLLHFHSAASQITCNCTASFCIWTRLLLHQPVYWRGADIGVRAKRISHVSKDGTQWCFIKDIWSLVFLQAALCDTISGMISTSIRCSHYCNITSLLLLGFFFPQHRFPCSTNVSNISIYVRENENVFSFFRFFWTRA